MTECLRFAWRRPFPRFQRARRGRGRAPLWFVLLASLGLGAPVLAESVSFELGVAGAVVAGAWNPLRLTLHDVPPSTLELRVDDGSLRDGARIARYSMSIPGGSGVTVYEDDIYVPRFRSLNWSLANAQRVIASGSLGVREVDDRPLDLLLSGVPGRWREGFQDDARLVDVASSQLPDRVAAYDGVRSLVIDGSTAAPRLESVAAAATGGVHVLLLGDLPASQAELALLGIADGAGSATRGRLGAGSVAHIEATPAAVAAVLNRATSLDRDALTAALVADPLVRAPLPVPQVWVLSLAGAFVLLTLALVRLAGSPGVLAVLLLAGILTVAAWQFFRPQAPVLQGDEVLWLGGGDLALRVGVAEVLTLPAGEVDVTQRARPEPTRPYRVDATGTHVALARWDAATLVLRPTLSSAVLRLHADGLHNAGSGPLIDVYVVGGGPQAALAAGQTRAAQPAEEGDISPLYERLIPLLPEGAALGRDARGIWLALPPFVASLGTPP